MVELGFSVADIERMELSEIVWWIDSAVALRAEREEAARERDKQHE